MPEIEPCFAFSDVRRVILRYKNHLQKTFLYVFLFAFMVFSCSEVSYEANASLRKSSLEENEEKTEFLQALLPRSSLFAKETGAEAVLRSTSVVKTVVEKLGLQVCPVESFLHRCKRRLLSHLCVEMGGVPKVEEDWVFREVSYAGVRALELTLLFDEASHFFCYDSRQKRIAEGRLGESVEFAQGKFTLEKLPKPLLHKPYKIQLRPWVEVVKKTSRAIDICRKKKFPGVLFLSIERSSPAEAATIINSLLEAYQEYVCRENEEITSVHLAYLEKRQEELLRKYEGALSEHAAFLASSLSQSGMWSFAQEVDVLQKPSQEYMHRLYELDLQMGKTAGGETDPSSFVVNHVAEGRVYTPPIEAACDAHAMQRLLEDCLAKHQEVSLQLRQVDMARAQLQEKNVALSSLGVLLEDAMSQEIIHKAGLLFAEKQEWSTHSIKDCERLEQSLDAQKMFLLQHVERLREMYNGKKTLLAEKGALLQKRMLYLLGKEKWVVEKKLVDLQKKMQGLPEKWKKENELLMKKDLSLSVVEGLTQLAESKNIQYKLFQMESRPIDHAFVPYKPLYGYVFLQSFGCALCAIFLVAVVLFYRWLSQGTVLTPSLLALLPYSFCGFLSEAVRGPLELVSGKERDVLRRAISFIVSQKSSETCVSIISPQEGFPGLLASLLRLQGYRVLYVECQPRLWQSPTCVGLYDAIRSESSIEIVDDYVSSGVYDPHYIELLYRTAFVDFITQAKNRYDVVLLAAQAAPEDPILLPLQRVSSVFVIQAEDVLYESIQTLSKVALVLTARSY